VQLISNAVIAVSADLYDRMQETVRDPPARRQSLDSRRLHRSELFGTAELYDPSTGAFTSTGNMNRARMGHISILLTSGKVLLAGGEARNPPFPQPTTAEVYDPVTGKFTAAGDYNSAAGQLVDLLASATLLPDGRVLLAGNTEGVIGVYDPVIGGFSPTGNPIARGAAALLRNGTVLVTGGDDDLGGASSLTSTVLPPEYSVPRDAWRRIEVSIQLHCFRTEQ
jgi:hypothetical protein